MQFDISDKIPLSKLVKALAEIDCTITKGDNQVPRIVPVQDILNPIPDNLIPFPKVPDRSN